MIFKIYGKENCTKCTMVKNTLNKNNIVYEYIDVEKDIEAKNKLTELNAVGLPVIETNINNETKFYTDYTTIIKTVTNLIKEVK